MTEKLGEIGDVLKSISEAVKSAKSLGKNGQDLGIILEQTRKHAEALESLEILNEPLLQDLRPLLKELKQVAQRLCLLIANLQDCLGRFMLEANSFDQFVTDKIPNNAIPPEVIAELCEALNRMHKVAMAFTEAFGTFTQLLCEAQESAANLTEELKKRELEMNNAASSRRNWGIAGTAGLVLAGAGLAALGFFTGGATWVPLAGAAAGVTCVVVAGVVAATTVCSVKEMRDLASGILKDANKLDAIAKRLKTSCDKAGAIGIKLDLESQKALETAILFFKRDALKDKQLAEQKEAIVGRDAEISELKAKLKRDAEIAEKDAEIVQLKAKIQRDAEIAAKNARIAELEARLQSQSLGNKI